MYMYIVHRQPTVAHINMYFCYYRVTFLDWGFPLCCSRLYNAGHQFSQPLGVQEVGLFQTMVLEMENSP